ncbi:MAG: C4-dicarboxylate ABC transporter substrate-binding protein [Hyphomicrobiales bacterium]|nr:MAG: C4-dicarboxylate ABC transporter substrate-binding protein [Hyphomicrobiales bacterium]
MRRGVRFLWCLAALMGLAAGSAAAQDGRVDVAQAGRTITPVATSREAANERNQRDRVNNWSIGLAAGRTEGAPLQFAAELARVLDDGDNMRLIPMVTRGPFDNIYDLLYLRNVDAAIVYGDVLDHFKSKPEFGSSVKRINYLMSLFPSEVHIFVRPEINSLKDLEGKVVNFNTQGTAAAFSGPIIFGQLGINVKETFIPHSTAMEKMRAGNEVAATFWVSSKPLAPFLKGKFPPGFKFLPIEYTDKLEYYTPAYLENADYPTLIPEGTRVATISVPAVLAVADTPGDTAKKLRISRFVDYLFERFERLQKEPGYHEKWKDVNLAATVPGWKRYPVLQEKLDRVAAQRPDPARPASKGVPTSAAEQEKLFQQFLEWHRKQAKQ